MPRFTVVIYCRDAESTLADTLDSLVAQTFTDWTALVIDDGSTDSSRCVAWDYASSDPRIDLARPPLAGAAAARNLALKMAGGEIIAFCNADDIWAPQKLEQLDIAFRNSEVDGLFGRIGIMDGKLRCIPRPLGARRLTVPGLLLRDSVGTLSNLALRRDTFRRSGGFDPRLRGHDLLDFLVRVVGQGADILGLDALLVSCRRAPEAVTAEDQANARRGRRAALRSARKLGYRPARASEARQLRCLAEHGLQARASGLQVLHTALHSALTSPVGFFPGGPLLMLRALLRPLTAKSTADLHCGH